MNRLSTVLLATALALAMSGCSADGSDPDGPDAPTTAGPGAARSATPRPQIGTWTTLAFSETTEIWRP